MNDANFENGLNFCGYDGAADKYFVATFYSPMGGNVIDFTFVKKVNNGIF